MNLIAISELDLIHKELNKVQERLFVVASELTESVSPASTNTAEIAQIFSNSICAYCTGGDLCNDCVEHYRFAGRKLRVV
jgi:hypothetical protein